MLPPPCFTVGMLPGFLQMWRLAFRPKSSILVSSDQRILFLMVWDSFRCLLANSQAGCHLPFTDKWLPSGHSTIIFGGVLQRLLYFWKVSHLCKGTLELCQSDHRVFGHLPDQNPSPQFLSLAEWPALGRVLVVPNFFHLIRMFSWGPSMLPTFFGILLQICSSTQFCLRALWTIPSTS